MKYEKLSKVFYKQNRNDYEKELEKRKNCYGSYVTPLQIRGFRKGKMSKETYPLFYVNIHELMTLNNRVLRNSTKISSLISKLPTFVIEPYFERLIVNEAQSNNKIEGVRSTKKELIEALEDVKKDKKTEKRFNGLMKTYLFIDEIEPFTDVTHFRQLYDDLVADEIKGADAPDGELFRKEYVEVNDGIKTTHIGVLSEKEIIKCLSTLIDFLTDDSYVELYRYMIAHYYYEYVHPFYDGNGRTGRLFVCSYLARYLDKYSAITFSYAINQNKEKYYKALEEIPSPFNQGEMTFYLITMLELLSSGQEQLIEDLEMNFAKMTRIQQFFNSNNWAERKEEAELLQKMVYLSVFVDDERTFPVTQLMSLTDKTRYKVNQIMTKLEDANYVKLTKQRPKQYKLTDYFLEKIFIF